MSVFALVVILLLNTCCAVLGVKLPGVSPKSFVDGFKVLLKANKVSSTKNPLQYDYYDLPFCKKKHSHQDKARNIGETISGDTLTTSPYEVLMKRDEACVILCRKKYSRAEVDKFKEMIDNDYRVHW